MKKINNYRAPRFQLLQLESKQFLLKHLLHTGAKEGAMRRNVQTLHVMTDDEIRIFLYSFSLLNS